MGVAWLKENLEKSPMVISCSFPGNRCLDLSYRNKLGGTHSCRIYTPEGTEYLVGQDVVDKAKENGVTVLVAGHFCQVSMAAKSYATSVGIPIVTNKEFFYKINNGLRF